MSTYQVEGMTIEIEGGAWRLTEDAGGFMPILVFEIKNGSGVMQYRADFAEEAGLPGDHMATHYVRAVVVGYKAADLQWLVGLHVSSEPEEKPRWVQLAGWRRAPNTRYATEAQEAGRVLAEYVGCPLKIFGVKKMPNTAHTGPLVQHERHDIDSDTVSTRARKMTYPGEFMDMKLEDRSGNGIAIKIGKSAASLVQESPPYHNIEVDTRRETVKMFPPTGLLGAFLGGARGREVPFRMVRNIELRHTIRHESEVKEDTDSDMMTEDMTTHYEWGIYLTIPNESILMAATAHSMRNELNRKRADKSTTQQLAFADNVNYYRKLEEDQEAKDTAREWAERASYIIASSIGCRLVETQVGSDY